MPAKLMSRSTRDTVRNAAIEECARAIPTNWCDPLLTGPDAPRAPLGSREMERLLRGIQDRIRALKGSLSAEWGPNMSTKTYVLKASTDDLRLFLRDLTAIEMRANAMGLLPAARALNNAKNAIGWQIAGNIEEADKASTYRC